ncbi:MAG: FecR domain-containing protein [Prevotella sp.]|jgi:ferric-dicitrate binding protein FerR (iron transport regulator)|nr:FecR domain-containing protein [Prevotella sp.]MCI1801953.1 FecR domain-containing protein [Prevotella sp.]MCI1815706.1 FecR domain-containing protein [Prevotella sp.]MCI1847667.1 FecR domain-containing protein [Prevotella sp.]MCI2151275.1 FecR domain-containing protein [Prevotella sp.]
MMDKDLRYVLTYYQKGHLDTDKAFKRFRHRIGLQSGSRRWQWIAMAASFLLLIGVGTLYYFHEKKTTLTAQSTETTCILPDGTRVILAPHASLSYRGTNSRTVEVSGKVYLEIRHDARNPFTIRDSSYVINDIGTRLLVDETVEKTTVYVAQGAVYFASSRNARRGVVVRKGTAAVLKKNSPNPELTDAVSPNSVTWATHQFHFYNTPLHDVLTDLSDYYHVSLSCNHEDIRLTGDFQTEKLDMIIEMIEQSLNVNITCEKKRR